MFIDHARIKVNGGNGGNGCCAFKREAYIANGGPNGGDGGNGGDVFLVATKKMATLLDVSYHAHWVGNRGMHGKGSDCHGKCGEEMIIEVPCGTVVREFHTGEILADLVEVGQRYLAARGGKGGRGNARFATHQNRAPKFAEKGEPGDEKEYLLELKVIAELGLVGLPNAGKSTLLAAVTAARPKIADYPFTTLSPNLGIVGLSGHRLFTMADIPGIIEGAAEGKGLGHDFLRHIERTQVLLFLIDLGDEDPVATRNILESELERYSPEFRNRPRLYAFNKADIPENRERFTELAAKLQPAWLISAATHEGLDLLLEALWTEVEKARQRTLDDAEAAKDAPEPDREYTYEAPFQVTRIPEGFEVEGRRPIQAVQMTDFDNEEGIEHLQLRLKKMGVFKALKRMGAQPGQVVRIGGVDLDYQAD